MISGFDLSNMIKEYGELKDIPEDYMQLFHLVQYLKAVWYSY